MDNITTEKPARRPIVTVIEKLKAAEEEVTFSAFASAKEALELLPVASLEVHSNRLTHALALLDLACKELGDIREQIVSVARAEAKAKART